MITALPVRPKDFLHPAGAILATAVFIGIWQHTPQRWAAARALDAAAFSFAVSLIAGTVSPADAKLPS